MLKLLFMYIIQYYCYEILDKSIRANETRGRVISIDNKYMNDYSSPISIQIECQ